MTSFSPQERIPTSPPCLLCDQEYALLTVEGVLMMMIPSPDPNTLVEPVHTTMLMNWIAGTRKTVIF